MNSHDEFRELAALRVYGELDASERERFERHQSACAACAALAHDLEAGLGRLVPAQRSDDLPGDWRAGLEAAIADHGERSRPGVRRSLLVVAAASFLVGATMAWLVASDRAERPQPKVIEGQAAAAAPRAAFERSTPPPQARDSASLPPLAELYLRR